MPEPKPEPPKPVREGSRWRYAKPSTEEVAAWFKTVPLDEGMYHADYIDGVVLLPANEKVKRPKGDGRGTEEFYEATWTAYISVTARLRYFYALADLRRLTPVLEPVAMPRIEAPAFDNTMLPEGFSWLVMGEREAAKRFLVATWKAALYESRHEDLVREGQASKAVSGNPDVDAIARAETGARGRALGAAGILVIGGGLATAEDMMELGAPPLLAGSPVTLPDAGAPEESPEALGERLLTLQAQLRPHAEAWREFSLWWTERMKASGWKSIDDASIEARRGVATKMESMINAILPEPHPKADLLEQEIHDGADSNPAVTPKSDADHH